MSFNREPTEFEQIRPSLFVTKHPGIVPFQMQSAPIALMPPVLRFLGGYAPGVPIFFVEHPAVQAVKDFFGYSRAKVVRPSPNDRVELSQDGLDVCSVGFFPQNFELRSHFGSAWFQLAAIGCHLPFPIPFTSFPDRSTLPPASRQPPFSVGISVMRPYLPSYAFLLPFGWQPSLLEASSSLWRVLRPSRSAYSEPLRLHWGYHVPHE